MGRKRKDDSLGLPKRVYARHGAFYYAHLGGRWERLGTDLQEAIARGNHYNDPTDEYGKMAWWIDAFLIHCKKRTAIDRKKGGMAPRTYADYVKDAVPLKAYFGKMLPSEIEGHHIAGYLDLGLEMGRPVRANREKACLSAAFTWMVRQKDSPVKRNPCLGIRRNKETKRDRYVTHAEFDQVWTRAEKPVRGLMDLIYRTLQRPEDIITWGPSTIVLKRESDGTQQRVLRVHQDKTLAPVDIKITPEIDAVLAYLQPSDGTKLGPGMTFIRTRRGEPYTYSGICSMLRRYINGAKVQGFGFYDLKGKGATDMWRAGVPLEQIQVLCGHESVTTTEIYVKARWVETVEPNRTLLAG